MIIAGIGCRRGASAAQINAAIAAALARAGVKAERLTLIATAVTKMGEAGITAAAMRRGVPLLLVPQMELEAAGRRTATRSERALKHMNVPSLAEAAALAAGGPSAQLLLPRVAVGPATCALATGDAP